MCVEIFIRDNRGKIFSNKYLTIWQISIFSGDKIPTQRFQQHTLHCYNFYSGIPEVFPSFSNKVDCIDVIIDLFLRLLPEKCVLVYSGISLFVVNWLTKIILHNLLINFFLKRAKDNSQQGN